jgi:hypothetical protein
VGARSGPRRGLADTASLAVAGGIEAVAPRDVPALQVESASARFTRSKGSGMLPDGWSTNATPPQRVAARVDPRRISGWKSRGGELMRRMPPPNSTVCVRNRILTLSLVALWFAGAALAAQDLHLTRAGAGRSLLAGLPVHFVQNRGLFPETVSYFVRRDSRLGPSHSPSQRPVGLYPHPGCTQEPRPRGGADHSGQHPERTRSRWRRPAPAQGHVA